MVHNQVDCYAVLSHPIRSCHFYSILHLVEENPGCYHPEDLHRISSVLGWDWEQVVILTRLNIRSQQFSTLGGLKERMKKEENQRCTNGTQFTHGMVFCWVSERRTWIKTKVTDSSLPTGHQPSLLGRGIYFFNES